jgi:hypothetical protein
VAGLAHAGDELIHDADVRAHKFVFGAAAEFGNVPQRQTRVVEAHQGKGRSHFNRGG